MGEYLNPLSNLHTHKKEAAPLLRQQLMQKIVAETIVRNAKTGYCECRSLNHLVDVRGILQPAAIVIKNEFIDNIPPEEQPTKVIGVSNRGKEFATILALETNLPLAITDRVDDGPSEDTQPKAWYEKGTNMTYIGGVRSFTKGVDYTHSIRGLEPGNTVLVADDFCARGSVTNALHSSLNELGIQTHFAYVVAKDFPFLDPPQVGFSEAQNNGISTFAVVKFIGMENGRVIASID
jgi:adenine/guanine phosphoribosyltransferase-like PRPP-binding protein